MTLFRKDIAELNNAMSKKSDIVSKTNLELKKKGKSTKVTNAKSNEGKKKNSEGITPTLQIFENLERQRCHIRAFSAKKPALT